MSWTPEADDINNADTYFAIMNALQRTYIESGMAVTVSGTNTTVTVASGVYYINGTRYIFAGDTLDIASSRPATSAFYNYTIIWINVAGALQATKGSEFELTPALRVSDAGSYIGTTVVGTPLAKVQLQQAQNIATNHVFDTPRFVNGIFPTISDGTDTLTFANLKDAHDQRGSQIAGTQLSWSGTQLDVVTSGLDADTLDTYHAVSFPRKAENATISGTWTFSNTIAFAGATFGTISAGVWEGTAVADTYIASSGTWNNAQAGHASLTSISGLTTVADRMIYTTASNTYAVATLTSAARSLLDDVNASAMRTTLGISSNAIIDWTGVSAGTIHATNYVDNDTTYISSDFTHNDLTGYIANRHIDWTNSGTITKLYAGDIDAENGVFYDLSLTNNTGSTTNLEFIGGTSPSSWTLRMNTGGVKLTDNATSWVSASDIRYKNNLEHPQNILDKIIQIDTIEYDLYDDVNHEIFVKRELGISAQQLKKHFPLLVVGEETTDDRLSVDYTHSTALFFGAFKEMREEYMTKIDALEARIKALGG